MRNSVIRFAAAVAIGGCSPPSGPSADPAASVLDSGTGDRVRAHIEVLAADDMQGREAGTEGYRKAAAYVASRFAEIGLAPLGDGGTYLQEIDFLETRLIPGSESFILHRGDTDVALDAGRDFAQSGGFGQAEETVTAGLIFVGFGIQAPEYGHEDYAGTDIGGKILVVLTGAPPRFANNERAFYSSVTGKQSLAVERGAVGIVTIRTPADQERLTWPRVLGSAGSSDMRWLAPGGAPHEGFPQLRGNAILSESGAVRLFELAGRDLDALFDHHDQGGTGSFEFDISATLSRRSSQQRTSSPNILAMLPGSDGALRHEHILLTAHLDHLGIRAGEDGDSIYNGAYDNSAGVATMLEVADALTKLSPAPRRSIIFAAVTAEEKGLRGSDFLAHNPPVAIENIVANVNVDMPLLSHPIADVEGFGVEHSTLHHSLLRVTEELGLVLAPDSRPDLVRLIRSDQFSFVKQGVPGLNLKPGSASSDPAINGSELQTTFLRDHYHSPSDDLALPFSRQGATRFAKVVLTLVLAIADDDEAPQWKDGDFFGKRYGKRERVH
jgi:hypothetical protein